MASEFGPIRSADDLAHYRERLQTYQDVPTESQDPLAALLGRPVCAEFSVDGRRERRTGILTDCTNGYLTLKRQNGDLTAPLKNLCFITALSRHLR